MTTYDPTLMKKGGRVARRNKIGILLRSAFGIERLRDGQQQVIDSVLDGNDTLAIMPTGSGKSLCYQIPARMLDGTTVVVSPLISLMKDQLEKLDAMGIRAAQVNSNLTREEEEAAPVLALTATATEDVVADIGKQLGRSRLHVVNTGIYRPNLHYRVLQVTDNGERYARACELVGRAQGVGIVYAATVKAAGEMLALLEAAGESVTIYHGKLAAAQRKVNQDMFMSGEKRVMVATNAFGMGIDKPDTRFVIHLQLPANLAAYYQESGRAGRDGADADCTLLYFPDDKRIQQFFLVKHYPSAHDLKMIHEVVRALSGDGSNPGSAAIEQAVDELASAKLKLCLKLCLKLLKDAKLLRQNRKLEYLVTAREPRAALFEELAAVYAQKQERDRAALGQMVAYAVSGFCRWKVLLDYFNDEVDGFGQCGRCDNCLNRPVVADIEIRDDEFGRPQAQPQAHPQAPPQARPGSQPKSAVRFAPGAQVRVPRSDPGTVTSVAGDQVTIAFPDDSTRTFLAEFVTPA